MEWFIDLMDLEEVDDEDIKVRMFGQILIGEARRWFTNLPNNSILGYPALEEASKEIWVERKDPRRFFS